MRTRRWILGLIAAALMAPVTPVLAASTHKVNGLIVFNSSRDGNSEIYVMRQDGSNQTRLTNNTFLDFAPVWSPDGSKIAFTSVRNGNWDIYVMNADGSGESRLTSDPAIDLEPAWSPDRSKIAFTSNRTGKSEIFVMNPDGSAQVSITGTLGSADMPDWSPDGSRIAFTGLAGSSSEIFVMDPDGSNVINLSNDLTTHDLDPTWSPNGGEIAFRRGATDGDIWKMRASGNAKVQLTNSLAVDEAPEWSPDGSKISFTTLRDGDYEVYVMHADGSSESNLTNHDAGADVGGGWARSLDLVGLVDPGSGAWLLSSPLEETVFFYGNPGDVPFMGDWDCDGIDTPGLFRLSDAFAYLRNSNTQGIADIRFFFGNPSDIPLAGDFNGDGCDTLSIYRPSEQRFYIVNLLGANDGGLGPAEFSFLFGNPGDRPFVGDFDGDGIDEVGLHRESTGFVYYRNTLDTGIADNEFFFGDPGDRFVAGDWGNVDGTDTPGLFRPGNTTFYFRHTNTQGNADSQIGWGSPSWSPVAGDF
jgi:WD40-like Beta Propeller Repeat